MLILQLYEICLLCLMGFLVGVLGNFYIYQRYIYFYIYLFLSYVDLFYFFLFFSCLTYLARTSSTILNRCGEIGCLCFVLGFSGKSKYVWFNYSPEIITANSRGCNLADLFRCITTYVVHTQSWFMSLLFVACGFFSF